LSRTLLLIVVLYLVFKPKPKEVHGNVDIGEPTIGSRETEWERYPG
jgi:hypothetical protein